MTVPPVHPSHPDVTPQDPRVQRSRSRIIQAAVELLMDKGARALTADAIAERSGVAKSTLYRHWPSIDALILDVFRAAMPTPIEIDPDEAFADALRRQVSQIADVMSQPEWIRLLPEILALRQQYPAISKLADDDNTAKEASLARILDAGAAEAQVPADLDPHMVAMVLLGPMLTCALFGEPDQIRAAGDYAVERFLASYRR